MAFEDRSHRLDVDAVGRRKLPVERSGKMTLHKLALLFGGQAHLHLPLAGRVLVVGAVSTIRTSTPSL